MKKIIYFVLSLLPLSLFSKDYYPENKSFTIEPSISSGVVLSLSDRSFSDGKIIELGMDCANIFDNVTMGIIGGYSYIYKDSDVFFNSINTGFRGGYKLNPIKWVGMIPNIGIIFNSGVAQKDINVELIIGYDFDFHITQRNILFVKSTLGFNTYGNVDSSFKLLFGIKKSIPVFINVPPIKYDIDVYPKRFSPDNDGIDDIMKINIKNLKNSKSVKSWHFRVFNESSKLIYTRSSLGRPPQIINWDGIKDNGERISSATDYFIEVEMIDFLGNKNIKEYRFLSDILIEHDGDNNIIRIDSIIFPPNSENLLLVSDEQGNKNSYIIRSIALKLQKFPEYNIRIEGHGNAIGLEPSVLLKLTTRRAMAIKDSLVLEGMDASRISVLGRGGEKPMVPFNSEDNWKNRRVEFILLK